jgi:uncharacterized protein (TIGR02145 family)
LINGKLKTNNMKTLNYFLILIVLLTFSLKLAAQAPHYEINGSIEGAEGVKFVLQKYTSGKFVPIDSAVSLSGRFKITGGSVEYPEVVYLAAPEKRKGVTIFLENSVITVTGKLDSLINARITGSKSQDEFAALQKSTKLLSDKMTKLSNEYRAANEALMTEMKTVQKDFVKNNPGSFVSPMILSSMSRDMKPEEVESMINALDPQVAKSPLILEIKAKMTAASSVVVGKKAPDFTLNDVNGKPVLLSSKIGPKLLLIDFWAGWCAPCRKENPNVLKVYNEFKKQGFDIIGVSLDRTKDDWVKAINDDKLPWTQVSDLNYFNCAAAKLYNVESIPTNFLLDEKGIIIAVNLRGEALYNIVKGRLVTGAVTDLDGNVYNTVTIGKQVWMTEDLKTTKYRNGDPIPNVIDTAGWGKLTTGAYCNIHNKEVRTKTFGRLYNWHTVNDLRNIAPKGWHIPTDAEWDILINYLGGKEVAGGKLKESGTAHWLSPNYGATNETGLSFLPGGNRNPEGLFNVIGKIGFWWSSTESSKENASRYNLISTWPSINRDKSSKLSGFSVRCVKD